jgi:hypothetical protein
MLIVAFGRMRSGKDTLADYLVSRYRFEKAQKLADPFKRSACEWFGWDKRHLDGELKEVVDPAWGFSPRQFFQVFGTDVMKYDLAKHLPLYGDTVGNAIWVKVFLNWYKQQNRHKNYVLADMRFPEEQRELARLKNVVFIKCVSDRSPVNNHSSEAYFDELFFDYEIVNNGWDTMDEYYRNIDSIMRLLEVRKDEQLHLL